ncbi:hypothetical protein EMPG_12271 [Blastomyces silverae]|uniref:Uncharacterized protein n=1 Tax=Blastomyces silverae TaxID=2060906 RepID=A0A0H1BUI5_9EURO|nr:hypothetical protein EMPG_12271 [Blastomyces silverae]
MHLCGLRKMPQSCEGWRGRLSNWPWRPYPQAQTGACRPQTCSRKRALPLHLTERKRSPPKISGRCPLITHALQKSTHRPGERAPRHIQKNARTHPTTAILRRQRSSPFPPSKIHGLRHRPSSHH